MTYSTEKINFFHRKFILIGLIYLFWLKVASLILRTDVRIVNVLDC